MPHAIIVGGGIGGLAAAIALRQIGMDVAVFERAPEIREVGAGLTIATNAIKCLRKLGVGEAVESQGSAFGQSEILSWRGKPIMVENQQPISDKLGAPTIGIHRADLQRILVESLPAENIHLDAECTGFSADSSGVVVRFTHGREERGDLLIGADGIFSRVRAHLHGSEKPRYAGYTAWRGVASIDHPAAPSQRVVIAVGRGSQFGIVPIGRGRTYWFATRNVPEGGKDPVGKTRQFLLECFQKWYPLVPAVIEATSEDAILRNDIIDRKPILNWGDGRVTLLGDAAHPTTPNLGQGACMAIEDAIVIARCLKEGPDIPLALRKYENQRYQRTAMITEQSWKLGKILAWEGRISCAIRDWLMRKMRGKAMRQTEEIIGYEV